MAPNLLQNLSDDELVRHFDHIDQPELRIAADRLHEMANLRRRLIQVEEQLAEKSAELQSTRADDYDFESQFIVIQNPQSTCRGCL